MSRMSSLDIERQNLEALKENRQEMLAYHEAAPEDAVGRLTPETFELLERDIERISRRLDELAALNEGGNHA